ncbi:replication restart helicase PriA [Nannocystaceae bacterium ST9]
MSEPPFMPETTPDADPRIVDVSVPVALDRSFSYRVPDDLPLPRPGTRVVVPFGARMLIGVVRPTRATVDLRELREVLELLDEPDSPALTPDLVELCEWIADYYVAPIGEVHRLALPGSAMGVDARRATITPSGGDLLARLQIGPLLGGRQVEIDAHEQALLERLGEGKPIAVAKLSRIEPPIPGVLRRLAGLAERGWVELDLGEAEDRSARTEPHYRRTDRLRGGSGAEPAIQAVVGRSKQRRALLDWLELQHEGIWTPIAELRGPFPRVRDLIAPLVEAGLVRVEERLRELDPFLGPLPTRTVHLELTGDQARAVEGLSAALDRGRFAGVLLHGITGSGKTEVYLQLIAKVRAEGGGAIVLVPEIALTPQLAERFRARFGDEVAVLHSGLTPQQRLDAWGHIRAGLRPIVIGARSAVFAPVPSLRVIVVDEEHDGSFKQEEGVRYNARDVALVRGRSRDAVVVLGSATPSLESWHGVREGRLGLWSLTTRPTPRPLPTVEVISLREHLPDPQTLLSAKLRAAVLETVGQGEQAILFLNRRGYTTSLSCGSCGALQSCPDCSSPSMTYHLGRNRLMCHLCGHIEAAPQRCPSCGSEKLEHGAAGTERVEVALASALPGVRVLRLDRDTSRGKALLDVLDRFRRREADVLIGTQMLSKGHDFPGVTLVGVLKADQGLALPDFRATERVFQLLTQVSGRAGRGDRPGRVIVQTWATEHPAIFYAKTHDFEGFAEHELAARRKPPGNPPATHLALVRVSGMDRKLVEARALELGTQTRELIKRMVAGGSASDELPVSVLGPVDSPIERINQRHRMQMLLRAPARAPLRWLLRHLRRSLGPLGRASTATLAMVDVDPYSLL